MPDQPPAFAALPALRLLNKLNKIAFLPGLMLCLAALGLSVSALAAPSNLDPAFGVLGKVVSGPDGTPTFTGSAMALQTDGRIVMAGERGQNGMFGGITVTRFNPDGSLDTTFGANGWTSVSFGMNGGFVGGVGLQADGKIVVGGTIPKTENNVPLNEFGVARLNADGSLDPTFDGDGKMLVNFDSLTGPGYYEILNNLKIGPGGKIVLAGTAFNQPAFKNRFILARINPDGSLDPTFGSDGKTVEAARSSISDRIGGMAILPDGKIVFSAYHHGWGGSRRIVAKFDAGGVKEWEYDKGVAGTPVPQTEMFWGMAALPDGKLIVVGKRAGKIVAVRLNADGTEDNTFIDAPGMPAGVAMDVAVQADGKIVATVSPAAFSLVRWNADGSLDKSFGIGGFTVTRVTGGTDQPAEMLIQPDGKILVGGTSELGSPREYYLSMARYLGSTSLPSRPLFDYDNDGRADISVFRPSENKWYILKSTDWQITQKIFAAAGDVPVPADYDGDGATDPAVYRFSSAGWWSLSSMSGNAAFAQWGDADAVAQPSDFDGDGKTDYIFYLPSNSTWYRFGSTAGPSSAAFGLAGDKPLTGDFDGDGKSDMAVYRPTTGDWWYASSAAGGQHRAVRWGISTDIPAPADYDADGKTDVAVYRPSDGVWYIINSSTGAYTIRSFGLAEDKPVPADYDGDGKADIAVFRPSTGVWYLMRSTAGFAAVQFGISSDIPTPNAFIR